MNFLPVKRVTYPHGVGATVFVLRQVFCQLNCTFQIPWAVMIEKIRKIHYRNE